MSMVPRRLGVCLAVLLLGLLGPGVAWAGGGGSDRSCGHGDRGRLLGFERVASHPTAADTRAYFDSWVEFYQDFYQFPANLPVDIRHGFDTYKVTYCTVDVAQPGRTRPVPTIATGNVSVPRKAGPLSTVAYLHGTSASFYDAPSNPNVAGELETRGESFDGPPSSAIFAGGGFVYVAPDYLIYDAFGERSDVFRQPYAATVPGLFDMRHFWDDILAGLPATSRELLTASYFREVRANPDHPMRVRLRENAVDRWRPRAPVRVYHSPVDEEVPFGDVLVSMDRLRRRGGDVTFRTIPGFDHVNSWVQAMPRAVTYFRTLD
jgi:hypothetical protein